MEISERIEVEFFDVWYTCDYCDKGEMRYNGITYTTDPIMYKHRCNNCGATESFTTMYPKTEMRKINDRT